MKKSIIALMLLCYCFCSWGGQEGVGSKQSRLNEVFLKARVTDFFFKPISGARVIVEGTAWQAQTDEEGKCEPFTLMPGTYTLLVTHPQYKRLIFKNFKIGKGGTDVSFTLKSGSPNDKPVIRDSRPLGQFVIDEDVEPIEKVEPVYPESALKDKTEGTVSLNVYVSETGEVLNAWVAQGVREDLNRAAMEAIQNFKFKPAKVKGKPVSVPVTIPFNFKLADKSTNYSLQHVEGPLTPDDVKQALAYLGVEIERFAYELPYKHKVKFWLEQYLDGKLADTKSDLFSPRPGKCSILVVKYQNSDSTIRYTINVASGYGSSAITFGNIPIKGFNARGTPGMSDIALRSGAKVPIYVHGLSPRGVRFGFGDPLDQIISRTKMVIVISAELQLE